MFNKILNKLLFRSSKEVSPPAPSVEDNLNKAKEVPVGSEIPKSISETPLAPTIPEAICFSFTHSEYFQPYNDYVLYKIETVKLRLLEARTDKEMFMLQTEARTLFSVLNHIKTQAIVHRTKLEEEKLKQLGLAKEPVVQPARPIPDSL